jgi:hypothetical protein
MRDRRIVVLIVAAAIGAIMLAASCAGAGAMVRAGRAPALDWRIPAGDYRILLIHNGPTITCAGLRDSCRRQLVRYEFYVHYITPTADRVLIWVPTDAP